MGFVFPVGFLLKHSQIMWLNRFALQSLTLADWARMHYPYFDFMHWGGRGRDMSQHQKQEIVVTLFLAQLDIMVIY